VASIRRCQENGATSTGEAPEKIAGRVWAALHGMILLRINTPNFDWQESLDDMTANVVAQLVGLDPNTSRHPEQEKPT
jgi:hypothetical protein